MGFGKQLGTVLPKVKGHVECVDHEYDDGLDSNADCDTEESSQMKQLMTL